MKIAIVGILLFCSITIGSTQEMNKSVLSSGASYAANSKVQLKGTVGQAIIGSAQSPSIKGSFGFWSIALNLLSTSITEIPNFDNETQFVLKNYPNPASDYTFLKFHLPQSTPLRIVLYSLQGRLIEIVHEEKLKAGSYLVKIDLNNIPVGKYIYSLQSGNTILSSKKLIVAK